MKEPRLRNPARALAFACSLAQLQAVAQECGYALAVHGSMATDLDLLAAPWTDEATDAPMLIEALREAVDGWLREGIDHNPVSKPHGRLAWSIYVGEGATYLDISVMPRQVPRLNERQHTANGEVQ